MRPTHLLALVVLLTLGCPPPAPTPAPAPPTPSPPAPSPSAPRALKVTSECAEPVWIQQQNHAGAPELTKLTKGTSTTYSIPDAGLPSTRYWAKTGCDAEGNNCKVGQSSPPCPANGCAPPVDSKLEATWGCTLPKEQKEQCAMTAQGHHVKNTFWNASAVDGFTLPFAVFVSEGSEGCAPVNCAMLDQAKCPADEDLPPAYPDGVDLRVQGGAGCFSPCTALTYPAFGGKGIQPPSASDAAPYCCPTPPVSPEQCNAGPVVKTKYVEAIHALCMKTTYGYAYDDALGLRQCAPTVELNLVFCPGVPASP